MSQTPNSAGRLTWDMADGYNSKPLTMTRTNCGSKDPTCATTVVMLLLDKWATAIAPEFNPSQCCASTTAMFMVILLKKKKEILSVEQNFLLFLKKYLV